MSVYLCSFDYFSDFKVWIKMPKAKKDAPGLDSGIQVIETATMNTISEQLRVMTQKIDGNQREIAQARAYAKEAKLQAAAMKHQVEDALENKPEPFTFKSKGNEKQYLCVMSAINNIIRAMTCCEEGYVENANAYHKRALAKLQERAKCIKIADRMGIRRGIHDEGCRFRRRRGQKIKKS